MRLARAALFAAATGCAAHPAARRASIASLPTVRESLHITIVYPDTADRIQAQEFLREMSR